MADLDSELRGLGGLAPELAIERLAKLRDTLATVGDPEALTRLAAALPRHVARLAPEVTELLAELGGALAPYGPSVPLDVDELESARLRVAWLRVRMSSPDAGVGDLSDETLLAALTGWTSWVDALPDASALFQRLSTAKDSRLRVLVVEQISSAVAGLALSGEQAFDCLEKLAVPEERDVEIRAAAIRHLSKFWLGELSPQRQRLREVDITRGLMDAEPRIVKAAIDATVELSMRAWLEDLLLDDVVSDENKAAALSALGPIADATDLDIAIALAERDPVRFGGRARSFLLEAHRHGVFLRTQHIAPTLRLFDAHDGWTGEELVRVTYIVRRELIDHLAELPPSDRRWTRRASILAASLAEGAPRLLSDLLDRVTEPPIAAALIDAMAASPKVNGEERLLRWLDVLPENVLPALRVKGGAKAQQRLRTIALDRLTAPKKRAAVMEVLWALTHDRRGLLTEMTRALPPHESGLLETKYLSTRDSTAAELLSRSAAVAEVPTLDQLKIFCESGDVRFLADVERLFRDVFRSYVRAALEGDFTIKRLLMPELEQLVFRYGRHLIKDGRSVRRWVERGPETGRDLVLRFVVDWLLDEQEPPSDPITVALLETASRHAPEGAHLRFIEPFWRRGDANVRRAAIEALVAAGAGARGLELSLGRLVADAHDGRILTQALAAVRTLRASWAEPLVRAVLERPEMAVKKEAAEALAEIGTGSSVPALVSWIGRHDNASFRALLLGALDKSAGAFAAHVLVEAVTREAGTTREGDSQRPTGEARTKELLLDALSGRIRVAIVLRLAASRVDAHRAVVDACLDGRVIVSGKKPSELAELLHRAQLRPVTKKDDPTKRLRVDGFSPEAALEVAELRAHKKIDDPTLLSLVRGSFAAWLTWAHDEDARPRPDAKAVALLFDAAERGHAEHGPQLLTLLEAWATRIDMSVTAAFLERTLIHPTQAPALLALRMRAISLVRAALARTSSVEARTSESEEGRASSVGGLRLWRLLGRLGAVRSAVDLERCFASCLDSKDAPGETLTLLSEAFSIPPPRAHEPEAQRDRELEALYAEAKDLYRKVDATAWIRATAKRRPIDLPQPPRPRRPLPKPPAVLGGAADLEALLREMNDEGRPPADRHRAALRLLDWSDATPAHRAILDAHLRGLIELPTERLSSLIPLVDAPPLTNVAEPTRTRLVAIVPSLTDAQLRDFVPRWISAWDEGNALAGDLLSAVDQERLLPFVIERATRPSPSFTLVRLLRPPRALSASQAMRALRELTEEKAPAEAEHLRLPDREIAPANSRDPIDPIEGQSFTELVALLDAKGVDKGLAVRAVHALTRFKERAVAPLARLAVDRRAPVRSAALRALRTVATKERTLEVTAEVLKMETRRDVALSLMASLGHGRHEPSLAGLLERLTDRDPRIRRGAHDALLAWGRDVVPSLHHANRRARPDRRPLYEALIAELTD